VIEVDLQLEWTLYCSYSKSFCQIFCKMVVEGWNLNSKIFTQVLIVLFLARKSKLYAFSIGTNHQHLEHLTVYLNFTLWFHQGHSIPWIKTFWYLHNLFFASLKNTIVVQYQKLVFVLKHHEDRGKSEVSSISKVILLSVEFNMLPLSICVRMS